MSSTNIYHTFIDRTPYTYFIRWNDLDLNYYGRRTAKGCHPNELFISYFSSSDLVKEIIDEYGYPDHIIVHRVFSDVQSCIEQEEKYLMRVNAAKNLKFLNKSNGDRKFDTTGITPIRYSDTTEKTKRTSQERYGVDHYNKTDEFKERQKHTCKEKYGVDYYTQTEEYIEKTIQSNQEKYGVDYYCQTEEAKERNKQTCLNTYGVEYYLQSEDCREKSKLTNLGKYGVDHPMQNEAVKEKGKQTTLERYGVDNYAKTDEYKEKFKNTHLEKYGVDHPAKIPFVSVISTKKTYNKTNAKNHLKGLLPYF